MIVLQDTPAGSSRVRYYALCAGLTLALAAFNLTFRLGSEFVTEWDESLYAVSAWEMVQNHQWIGTTFKGELDYYNTKPPLNIWLIALSFKAFGASLVSLRLPSMLWAWLTVLVLQVWTRRAIGDTAALVAALALSTSFGSLYDHSGRSANTDALFTLLVLSTAVTLWAADRHPWRLVWLGPVAAATFLLRGMGVLMPLALFLTIEVVRRNPWRPRRLPLLTAAVLFTVPVTLWMWARWRLDEWRFLGHLFTYDFVARSIRVIEGHEGSLLYYLDVFQRNQIDWVAAGVLAWCLVALPWSRIRSLLTFWHGDTLHAVAGSWAIVTLLIPTLMRTKLSWYLNPFYPVFAMGLGWLFMKGLTDGGSLKKAARPMVLVTIVVLAAATAEARLLWYSVHRRNLERSTQGFLLAERSSLAGGRVYSTRWDNSDLFVLTALIGAEAHQAATPEEFVAVSAPGDLWLSRREVVHAQLLLVRPRQGQWLYQRADEKGVLAGRSAVPPRKAVRSKVRSLRRARHRRPRWL